MAKIKITTLTDKMKDEEILSKLKSIGVKIKDKEKEKEEPVFSESKEKSNVAGETVIEKRVASTVIRRRVQAPPPPPVEIKQEPIEAEEKAQELQETKKEESVIELVKKEKEKEAKQAAPAAKKAAIKIEKTERVEQKTEEEAAEPVEQGGVKGEAEVAAPVTEETAKPDIDIIGEEKKQEITRALEEVYKQDLDKEFTLVEDEETEEERKKKKAERLLKKIEEEEIEEAKLKGKGPFKRKVVIKEEDLYAFRRQKGKTLPFRKGAKGREAAAEDDRKAEAKPARKSIRVGDAIQVGELAKRLSVKASDVIAKLLALGTMSTLNQNIDYDTAYIVAGEFGYEVDKIVSVEEEFMTREGEQKEQEAPEDLKPRSPVVTIMGHVDHGKTLLLDTIRNTNVAEREAGGITQHIGAYIAKVDKKEITFVDTPGHEAFTAMRARGALVTDIVILVVAADDGVMPQTREAIDHAKAADVPIIVAVNKIDKQNSNPDKVMKELTEFGLQPEEWGGTTLMAKISAKKKVGIQELLELILLQAELLELKANPDKQAKGIIIESGLDKGHGPFGTVIIQEGTLKIQDPFVAGTTFGRVRALIDDKGKKAPPATPVMVVGFSRAPGGRHVRGDDGRALRTRGLQVQTGKIEREGTGQELADHAGRALFANGRDHQAYAERYFERRRARYPGCDQRGAEKAIDGGGRDTDHPQRRRDDYGNGCEPCHGIGRGHCRLQREADGEDPDACGSGEGGHTDVLRYLRHDRRREEGHGRHARAEDRRSQGRRCGGKEDVRRLEDRHHRRLLRHGRQSDPERNGEGPAEGRRAV